MTAAARGIRLGVASARRSWAWLAVLVVAALGATSAGAAASPAVVLPPADGQFDYQLGGAYPPAPGVAIVDRDRSAAPVAGHYNVCYVNAFQSQPAARAWWRARHPGLLLRSNGRYVSDADWPGEILLDTSTAAKRRALARIVGGWIRGCARAGFQAVEPDNLDSWTRSRGRLTRADNRAFATLLASRAHAAGLAIAQKNTVELAPVGRAIGFDFAIAEECHAYDECGTYVDAYGTRVYEIEYVDQGGTAGFAAACAALGSRISIVLRDRDVVPRGAAGYRYEAC
jgi:hypothetical protein